MQKININQLSKITNYQKLQIIKKNNYEKNNFQTFGYNYYSRIFG